MPRLPERYKTRWGYSAVAGFAGVLTAATSILILQIGTTSPILIKEITFGLVAAPAAILCWPISSPRSVHRMIIAGILTVLVAFLLLGLLLASIDIILENHPNPHISLSKQLLALPYSAIGFAIVGSVISIWIPYIVGAFLSVFFAD